MFDAPTKLCPQDPMQSVITMPSNNPAFQSSTTRVRAAFVTDCPHMRVLAKIPIFNFMTSLHTYAVSGEQEKKKYVISHTQEKQSIRYDNKVLPGGFYLFDESDQTLEPA